jgi:N-acetylglucosaminyldiphosphoundecaprenol N-acetyl-beta-D-mannosaminyltransferase
VRTCSRVRTVIRREATVLGTRCFVGDIALATEGIIERLRTGAGGYVCQANVHLLIAALHDDHVRKALDEAWVVHPDGAPVSWLARRVGASQATRIAGPDLMTSLFGLGATIGLRHYLFGSTPEVIEQLRSSLSAHHPDARIVGAVSPPFGSRLDEQALKDVAAIRQAAPDIVWCGLGAPKQELWMNHYAGLLAPALVIGVGAAFDFHAGAKLRAPAWMQRRGLEWAHRLWSEPRRLAGRYARTNSEFIVRAALEIAAARLSARKV